VYDIMKGIKVVEVAAYVFVPVAGAIMADWGAEVIKVEHPTTGDPYRGLRNDFVKEGLPNPMLELPNRGKRSVGIDIATPEGLDLLYKLVEDADVFLTSFMTGPLNRLKIDFESIKKINPKIVYVRGSGFGTRGPDADKPGFDAAATWARGGLLHRMTPPDAEAPVSQPGSVGDLTGGLTIATGISAALFARERSGEAQQVDVSLYHVGMWIMSQSIGAAPLGLAPTPSRDTRANPWNPLVNTYRTGDNRWLMLCMLQPDPYWPDFCDHIGRADLTDDPRFNNIDTRQENSAELIKLLDEVFAERTLAQWRDTFVTLKGVWAPALSANEIAVDPQVLENGYFPEVEAEDGTTFRSVASPIQFGGELLGNLKAMPEHGQHTEEVLLEMGYSWENIADLKESGAVL
jgi:crotonobetainyl-CoA:carnitine CoA-transferase CaiB-like acyl-CoA transferase